MTSPAQDRPPRRGWQRGLLFAGLALALAWTFRAADRRPPPRRDSPAVQRPPVAATMPADASLGAPALATPRLLVLLPDAPADRRADFLARLRNSAAGRLVVAEGDAEVARGLGLTTLPAFVLYDTAGREQRRLSGIGAIPDLSAALASMGIDVKGLQWGDAP